MSSISGVGSCHTNTSRLAEHKMHSVSCHGQLLKTMTSNRRYNTKVTHTFCKSSISGVGSCSLSSQRSGMSVANW
jgi:hypothetical protein